MALGGANRSEVSRDTHSASDRPGEQAMLDDDYPFHRQVASPLTDRMLRPLDPRCRVVQLSSPLTEVEYSKLAAFLAAYPDTPLRVYGHGVRDLEFLKFFPTI